MSKNSLADFAERLETSDDLETLDLAALAKRTRELLSDLGQHDFSVFSLRQEGDERPDLFLGTMTENWSERYIDQDYREFDPVLSAITTARGPYTWADIPRRTLSPKARQLFADVEAIGYVNGVVVPMQIPGVGRCGFATFARQREVTPGIKMLLDGLGRRVARRVDELQRPKPAKVTLTEREAEILRWVASGRSASQVGMMTAISPRTVEYHLSNVQRKLNTNNQTNSVAVAVSNGMLRI